MISKAKQAERAEAQRQAQQEYELQSHLPVEVLKQITRGDWLEIKWFDSGNSIVLVVRVDHSSRVKLPTSFEFWVMDFNAPKDSYLDGTIGTVTGDQVVAVRGNVTSSIPGARQRRCAAAKPARKVRKAK